MKKLMAYKKFYYGTDWHNLPSRKTALNRKNLIHLDNGVEETDNRILHLDESKADLSLLNSMVKYVTLDTKTGILTVTLSDGTTKSYDLDIEIVVTNFDINDDNELVSYSGRWYAKSYQFDKVRLFCKKHRHNLG